MGFGSPGIGVTDGGELLCGLKEKQQVLLTAGSHSPVLYSFTHIFFLLPELSGPYTMTYKKK